MRAGARLREARDSPFMMVDLDVVDGNIASMARWCVAQGVELSPHAKTTMSPQIVAAQIDRGAWGITASDVDQAAKLRRLGVKNILIANQVVGAPALAWLVAANDEPGEIACWVDSLAQVELMRAAWSRGQGSKELRVLLEVGLPGGRGGVRTLDQAAAVAKHVASSPGLRLVGVAGFEGTYATGDDPVAAVDRYLQHVANVVRSLETVGLFADHEDLIISVGGSMYFDRCTMLANLELESRAVKVILRSGCYVTHDHGIYSRSTPAARKVAGAPVFRAAVSVWAQVLSRPERGLALAGAGRRHLSYDQGLPVVIECITDEGLSVPASIAVTRLDDQHCHLTVEDMDGGALKVGDWVVFGISHPCSTFDRWRSYDLVRDGLSVATGETWFR
jgi:D-serine deaminase-like pyridoxal phosphate-dependent protein